MVGASQQGRSPQSASPQDAAGEEKNHPVKVNVLVAPHLRRSQDAPAAEEEGWDEEVEGDRPKVRVLIAGETPSPRQRRLSALVFLLFWLLAGMGVVGGGWLAIQLIVNPGAVGWLSRVLPNWDHRPLTGLNEPRTLAEIRSDLEAAGLWAGEPFPLTAREAGGDLLLPVLARRDSCTSDASPAVQQVSLSSECRQIVELRVYRPENPARRNSLLRLMDRLAVRGPAEYSVVAPLVRSPRDSGGSPMILPYSEVQGIEGTPPSGEGIWFQLTNTWQRGSNRVLYGQVFYYHPGRSLLSPLLQWTSPPREAARWQAVTGDEMPELLVNQTVGLEPDYWVYRVNFLTSPFNPVQLDPVSISQRVLDRPAYENALLLARNGLWTPALEWMAIAQRQGQNSEGGWSAIAQAQMDVIALHAEWTAAQAERDWASPTQTVTALLIDGQWETALERLKTLQEDGYDLTPLLRDESRQIWQRVGATLRANPDQPAVQAWGVLVVATRQNRADAIAWLQQQLERANTPLTEAAIANSPIQTALALLNQSQGDRPSHASRILGTATRISAANPADWLLPRPDAALELAEGQVWYRVRVSSFYDGQRWRRSPFSDLNLPPLDRTNQLWSLLGLGDRAPMQLLISTGDGGDQTLQGTVRAVQWREGTLDLLVSSAATDPATPPLAITTETLRWLQPDRTLSLSELQQQQPDWVAALLPRLQQELRLPVELVDADADAEVDADVSADPLAEIGYWSVQLIDLTGNGQPEALFVLRPAQEATPVTDAAPTIPLRTVIFSDRGELIYSDVGQGNAQSLRAIADLGDGGTPALVLSSSQSYQLRRWSASSSRFE